MSLRDLDTVDFMGYDEDKKVAYLIIVDEVLVEAGYGFQYVHKPFDETEQTNNIID